MLIDNLNILKKAAKDDVIPAGVGVNLEQYMKAKADHGKPKEVEKPKEVANNVHVDTGKAARPEDTAQHITQRANNHVGHVTFDQNKEK